MRDVIAFLLMAFWAYGAVLVTRGIGQIRPPITKEVANGAVVLSGLMICGIAYIRSCG